MGKNKKNIMAKRKASSRRSFLKLGALSAASLACFYLFRNRPFSDLSQDLSPYGKIADSKNENGEGTIYLIGQEHFNPSNGREGYDYSSSQKESLADVQSEIFGILDNLSSKRGLELVIGEGMGAREIDLSNKTLSMTSTEVQRIRSNLGKVEFRKKFLSANPRESGYTLMEIFYPEKLRLLGVEDSNEMLELANLDKELFNLALKYVPTLQDYNNPANLTLLREAEKPLEVRRDRLNDLRSGIYLNEGIRLADYLGKKDFAIVIGSAHLPLMTKEYHGKRKLKVIMPVSVNKF